MAETSESKAILDHVLLACCILFLAVTSVATLLVTCVMPGYNEAMYVSYAQAPLAIAGVVAVVALAVALVRTGAIDRIPERRLRRALVVYALVFAIVWAYLIARSWPEWDSKDLINASRELLWPDSGFFARGGYVYRFPYQLPFIYLIKVFDLVTLHHPYVLLEALNIGFTAWLYWLIPAFAKEAFGSRRVTVAATLICFVMLPPLFNVTFVYPNATATALAMLAMLLQLRAIRRGDLGRAVASAAVAIVAYLFKSTMLLVVAAMAVTWLAQAVRARSPRQLAGVVALAVCYVLGTKALGLAAAIVPGMDTSQGMPASAYVVMGLTEKSDGSANEGWYTGYIWDIEGEQYSPEAYREDASARISQRLGELAADPAHAAGFFATKFASEWCEPTHEALLASNWAISGTEGVPAMADRNMNAAARAIYYGPVNQVLLALMDIVQSAIAVFALVWACVSWRKADSALLSPMLCAAGTGLFYLMWEAKSQYTLHAYVMLIPFAAAGLIWLAGRVAEKGQSK